MISLESANIVSRHFHFEVLKYSSLNFECVLAICVLNQIIIQNVGLKIQYMHNPCFLGLLPSFLACESVWSMAWTRQNTLIQH